MKLSTKMRNKRLPPPPWAAALDLQENRVREVARDRPGGSGAVRPSQGRDHSMFRHRLPTLALLAAAACLLLTPGRGSAQFWFYNTRPIGPTAYNFGYLRGSPNGLTTPSYYFSYGYTFGPGVMPFNNNAPYYGNNPALDSGYSSGLTYFPGFYASGISSSDLNRYAAYARRTPNGIIPAGVTTEGTALAPVAAVPRPADNRARVEVRVPYPNAQVWFEGKYVS